MIIDDLLLDSISSKAKKSERLRMNYNLHDSLDSKAQRLFNALEPGTNIPIHRHRHTSETYLLIKGRIKVFFYDEDGNIENIFCLSPQKGYYGVHIPKGQWHSLEVLESSVIFEVKEGPYKPLTPEDIK